MQALRLPCPKGLHKELHKQPVHDRNLTEQASVTSVYSVCMQGPTGARQRLTGDGGDPGTPNTRQLVDEAADMLSTLLASPDKVTSLAAARMYSWTWW